MKKTSLFFLPLLIALAACEPTVANRGNLLDIDAMAEIKPGQTTREEVATKLGTPTAVSTFDDKIWFYVGRQTEQYSFFDPKVTKQQAVEIDFDEQGIVTVARNLDVSKAADASPVDRETPTFGQENTFLRELLGDLTHPRPGLKNQRGSGT